MIICCDFDGTLCEHSFPSIGKPNMELIHKLKRARILGHKVILWTCRDKGYLTAAVEWAGRFGLYFDAVNDNVEEVKEDFVDISQKIYADIYLDDRNRLIEDFLKEDIL